MEDTFDMGQLTSEARFFSIMQRLRRTLASVFWLRRLAALGGEEQVIAGWQIKRRGSSRGIIEIVPEQT
jgi:hypothetical protein